MQQQTPASIPSQKTSSACDWNIVFIYLNLVDLQTNQTLLDVPVRWVQNSRMRIRLRW